MKKNGWFLDISRQSVPSLPDAVLAFLLIASFAAAPAYGMKDPAVKPAAVPEAANEEAVQAKDLTLYGEVQEVKAASGSMLVQYYNYDTDEEKTMEITFAKDTKIENAAGLADIKKGDWVDVSYATSGGKNVAGSVIVEKEEDLAEEPIQPLVETPNPAEEE